MLILGYCPKCGYVFSDKKEADVDDFSNSRCWFCRFSDGLIAESEVHQLIIISMNNIAFAPIPNGGAYRPTANNEQVIR